MVEFMRFGRREGDNEEAGAREVAFPLVPLVVVRDMAELIVPPEAGLRVDRGGSCDGFWPLLGVDLVGVDLCGVDLLGLDLLGAGLLGVVAGVAAAVSTGTTVTDERSKAHTVVSLCWSAAPGSSFKHSSAPGFAAAGQPQGTHPSGMWPSRSRGALPQGHTVCRSEPQRGNPRGCAVRVRTILRGGYSETGRTVLVVLVD